MLEVTRIQRTIPGRIQLIDTTLLPVDPDLYVVLQGAEKHSLGREKMASSALVAELSDLRQKARAIESARSRPPASSNAVDEEQRLIASQRSQIDKLKKENRQLQEELAIGTQVCAMRMGGGA